MYLQSTQEVLVLLLIPGLPLTARKTFFAVVMLASSVIAAQAQTFTSIAVFDKANGAHPLGTLAQGPDGNLYGVTTDIGANPSLGRVFQVTTGGTLTQVSGPGDGYQPGAGLVLGTNGNFYGTDYWGGNKTACQSGCGIVFEVTPTGTISTVHEFGRGDGFNPDAPLVLAPNGNFYGSTIYGGGSTNCVQGCGTIFQITPAGTFSVVHAFQGPDGKYPEAAIVLDSAGNLYGTTFNGGTNNYGTVFEITSTGTLTTLHSFLKHDGAWPLGMVLASDGNFYGITNGGPGDFGTVFKMTAEGAVTTLHVFDGTDGENPVGSLVQATGGNFFGATSFGGGSACFGGFGCGTIFEISSGGAMTTVHYFDGSDGVLPDGGLFQATDGNLYGTTAGQGAPDCGTECGTVYKLTTGLAPFVSALPTSGHDGNTVRILGTDLTGATSVTFNGKAADFTFVSATEIKTSVPMCAKSGVIEVTTPGGKLLSNLTFTVN
jgi:uncharacterized repeat protein (TIGR03803 family)